jgi:hypothetical protein
VLHSWREWTSSVADEVTSVGRIMRFPPLPEVPDQLRGQAFALVEAAYLGEDSTGADLLAPLRELSPEMDTFATIPAPALGQLHMDPTEPVPAMGDGALLAEFPAAAIDALVALAGPDADTPLISVEVRLRGESGCCRRSAAARLLPAHPADQDLLRPARRDHLPTPRLVATDGVDRRSA